MTAEVPDAPEPNLQRFPDQPLPDFRLKPGDVIAKLYKVLDVIGVGGMSTVYRCEDLTLSRIVAIKTMQAGFTPETLRRLQTEGKAIARLEHPNIVKMFGVQFIDDSMPCLVMEFVPGITLATLIQRQGALPVMRSLRIGSQICEGLKKAESEGIIHRDLKPSNIMILNAGTLNESVKILDFGIAKIQDDLPLGATRTGDVVGTPQYMSPEQAQGKKCDGRSDQYSLGCVLYEMLTGKPPFTGDNALSVMIAHLQEPVPSLSKGAKAPIPSHLEQAVTKLLQKIPGDRFATMDEASSTLFETPTTNRWRSAKSLVLIGTATALLLSLALGLSFSVQHKTATDFTVDKISPVVKVATGEKKISAAKEIKSDDSLTPITSTDRELMEPHGLDKYVHGQEANFQESGHISDFGLEQLGKLTNIKILNLRGCQLVTSAGLKRLKKLSLVFLNLNRTGINDDAADTLADMTALRELDLSETEVSSKTCRAIMSLPHLENLELLYSSVNGHSLPALARIKNLKKLNLGFDDVAGSLPELSDSGITELNLKGCKLTDKDFLFGLAKLKNLKKLSLEDTNVNGKDLESLGNLEEIDLHRCNNLTDQDISDFAERHPNCVIFPTPAVKNVATRPNPSKNLIANGDFEKGTTPSSWIDYDKGSPRIPDWSIVSGSVSRMGVYTKAAHGKNCLELNGDKPGAIEQTIATTPGATYEILFYAVANPDSSTSPMSMRLDLPGFSKQYNFENGISRHEHMAWKFVKALFVADSKSSIIRFSSTVPGACGVFIDDVSVRLLKEKNR